MTDVNRHIRSVATQIIQMLWLTFQKKQTPLHYASEGGHRDVIELLLQSGADANVKDRVNNRDIAQPNLYVYVYVWRHFCRWRHKFKVCMNLKIKIYTFEATFRDCNYMKVKIVTFFELNSSWNIRKWKDSTKTSRIRKKKTRKQKWPYARVLKSVFYTFTYAFIRVCSTGSTSQTSRLPHAYTYKWDSLNLLNINRHVITFTATEMTDVNSQFICVPSNNVIYISNAIIFNNRKTLIWNKAKPWSEPHNWGIIKKTTSRKSLILTTGQAGERYRSGYNKLSSFFLHKKFCILMRPAISFLKIFNFLWRKNSAYYTPIGTFLRPAGVKSHNLKRDLNVSRAAAMLKIAGQLACFDLNFIRTVINHEIYYCIFHYFN